MSLLFFLLKYSAHELEPRCPNWEVATPRDLGIVYASQFHDVMISTEDDIIPVFSSGPLLIVL